MIVQNSPISAHCDLVNVDSGSIFGQLYADWAFCYGNFGYGESYQLSQGVHKPLDNLHFSMFPRIPPQSGKADTHG